MPESQAIDFLLNKQKPARAHVLALHLVLELIAGPHTHP